MQRCGVAARRIVMGATQQQSFSFSSLAALGFPMLCGRGDKKTKKGKIFKGTYGNSRPKKEKKIERIKDKNEVPRSTPWPLPFKII
ncbi:30S ribosomal protein S31, mitochondrial [Linum perenne]